MESDLKLMRYAVRSSGLVLALALMMTSLSVAQEGAPAPEEKVKLLEQAEAVRKEAAQSAEQERQAREEIQRLRKELTLLKQTLTELMKKVEDNTQASRAVEQELAKQQEAAKAAEAAKTKADQTAAEAKKAFDEAKKRMEEAEKNAATAAKGLDDAKKIVTESEKKRSDLTTAAASLKKDAESAQTTMTQLTAQLPNLETAIATAINRRGEQDRQFETLMRQAGEWVSFSQQIAPIFQGRCVGCHQTKSAKGQFNLETYQALMKGGESGPAILPGDTGQSSLVTMLVEGTMPKDAEPLTPDQIDVVKRWVALGARLDGGVKGNLPLIRIMPRAVQPAAPERYSVPVPITAVAVHHSGTLLATSGYHEVLIWSLPERKLVRRLGNVAERIYDLAFQPGGDLLAAASGKPGELGEVKLFNVQDGTLQKDLLVTTDTMLTARFSSDGTRLAAAGTNQTVSVFDVASGEETLVIQDHSDWVQGVAWSADGKRLATASRDKATKVFDSQTGAQIVTFSGHTDTAADIAFLGDGSTLISSGKDQRLRIWKVVDGTEVRSLTGFGDDVPRLIVLPNETVVSASLDRRVRLHQLSDGKVLKTYEGSPVPLYSLAVSPDGTLAIAGGADGHVRVWNIESAKLEQDWSAVSPEPMTTEATPGN